jgi:hypothetical protein
LELEPGIRPSIRRVSCTREMQLAVVQSWTLVESWQLHEIVFRHLFNRLSSFAPGGESAGDHKRAKALFSE